MQVKVKIFEDYKIFGDEIYPVGYYQDKTLNSNDIRNALKSFLKIKTSKDAVNFARQYGLLNGYDFLVSWGYGIPVFKDEYIGGTLNTKQGICDCEGIFDKNKIKRELDKLNIKRIDDLKIDGKLSAVYLDIFFEGEIYSIFYDHSKEIFINFYDKTHKGESLEIPIDKDIIYPILDTQGLFGKKNKVITYESGWYAFRFDNEYIVEKYIDYILYFLQRLYEKSNKKMSTDYLYRCIGEKIGFDDKSKFFLAGFHTKTNCLITPKMSKF